MFWMLFVCTHIMSLSSFSSTLVVSEGYVYIQYRVVQSTGGVLMRRIMQGTILVRFNLSCEHK